MANKKADLRNKINQKPGNKKVNSSSIKTKSNTKNVNNKTKKKKSVVLTQKQEVKVKSTELILPNESKQTINKKVKNTVNRKNNSSKNKTQSVKNKNIVKDNKKVETKKIKQAKEKFISVKTDIEQQSNLENKVINKKELKKIVKEQKKTQKEKRKEEKKTKKLEKKQLKKQKKLDKKNKSNIIKRFFGFIFRKKIIISIFIVLVIAVGITGFLIYKSKNKIVFDFKSYKIGDKVTLKDDSSWYVIDYSSISESNVSLISEKLLDVNKDNKIDDKDKVEFDSENNTMYDKSNKNNIAFFIKDKVYDLIKNAGSVKNVRLLKSEEYIKIRKSMEFGYDWNEGNWLANDSVSSWWLQTSRYNKIYVVSKRGSYKMVEAKSKYYIRPVITIPKGEIKTNE